MYVVKRPFKSLGKVYAAGSVIAEPAHIKRFDGKVAEGKIIVVTEHNYTTVAQYFKNKYGVDIPAITKDQPKPEEPKPEEPKPAVAVVKATPAK